MRYLLLTVRWLDERYHGKLDRDGPAEWPPSPYRLFQAVVAALGRRGKLEGEYSRALTWWQALNAPTILAPSSRPGTVITRYVPNNDGDKKPNRQDRLKGKIVCPTLMLDRPEIHYLWAVYDNDRASADLICKAARSLTCLGWGIDMAHANGRLISESEICQLPGVRWHPRPKVVRAEGMLRTPVKGNGDGGPGTLEDLCRAHESVMARIERDRPLNTVEKPRVFDNVFYESKEQLLGRPVSVFELRHDDGSFCRYSQRKLRHIAGMVRHQAKKAMQKSPPPGVDDDWLERYVVGHQDKNTKGHCQFSYLPLPSIGHRHVDQAVRRVMITVPVGDDIWLEHLSRRLAGQRLKPKYGNEFGNQGPPTLIHIRRDNVTDHYTRPANTWASVTPVILPGHDDRKPAKTRKLIEAALAQSGIDQPCEFEWSPYSRFRKSLSAHKYDRTKQPVYFKPPYLKNLTAVHLTLTFNNGLKVPGPIAIGAGRHCGFGIFAAVD